MWWVPWRYKISRSVLLYSIRKWAVLLNFWLWLLGVPNEKQTNQSFLTNSDVNKVVLPMLSIKNMNRKTRKLRVSWMTHAFSLTAVGWFLYWLHFLGGFFSSQGFVVAWQKGYFSKSVWYVTEDLVDNYDWEPDWQLWLAAGLRLLLWLIAWPGWLLWLVAWPGWLLWLVAGPGWLLWLVAGPSWLLWLVVGPGWLLCGPADGACISWQLWLWNHHPTGQPLRRKVF